jgi:hypothetical protein
MANIRKSFNLRNGVQVDDDNFIVNQNGLVGVGTTIPEAFLDVRSSGDNYAVKVVGIVTLTDVYSGKVTSPLVNIGITSITSGIVTAYSGIITYYGDGSKLLNLPTSQWLDVDAGLGFTSIYAQGFVGVATNDPRYVFQVGGNNDINNFTGGVGINSLGDIKATGIITAYSFSGIGTNLTDIDADNITSGTISSERLPILPNAKIPNNFQVTGIITALGSFNGTLVGIASTARDLISNARISIDNITSNTSTIGVSTVSTRLRSAAIGVGTNSPYSAIHIVGSSSTSLHVTAATESTITLGRSLSPTGNTGGLKFGNTSGLYPYSTTKTLDVINYDTGNLNYYLHYGAAGVGTGNFNWIYAPSASSPLMSLTYTGNLGLGVTNPGTKLQVSGIASVSTLNVTGSVYATGLGATTSVRDLYVLNGKNGVLDSNGNSLFTSDNLNIASGISTFYDIKVTNHGFFEQRIAIGNTNPVESLHIGGDWTVDPEDAVVINSSGVGIGTTSIGFGAGIDGRAVDALLGGVGIGTTTPDLADLGFSVNTRLHVNGHAAVRNGDLYVGVNTSTGPILTSPNGNKYRLIVDNAGSLSTVLVP